VQLSTSQLVIGGVLAIVWAVLGYRLSENDRRMLGRTPWGLPSALWAFFWFLFLPLGLILYLIAHSTGVRQAQQHPPLPGAPVSAPPPSRGPASASDMFPAYPRPANSQPTSHTEVEPEELSVAPSEAGPAPGGQQGVPSSWPHSPPAWHPDPSGRFHFRWWDGHQWTSQVSTDGQHLIDTNPDQRIGPY
jgi:Protein of unknown function (DUF2510)